MRILYSGYHNPHFMSITEYTERAIVSLGHTLKIYDDRRFLLPGRVRERIKFLQDMELSGINDGLVRTARKFNPDVYIASGGQRISSSSIDRIKGRGVKTVLWVIDWLPDPDWLRAVAPHYDFIFAGGTEAIGSLKNSGIKDLHWLPFACDTDHHHPVAVFSKDREKYGHDIAFVGSYYPNRMKILEEMADLDVGVWGPGWQNVPAASPLAKRVKGTGNIKPDEWVKILCNAKIVIAIHFQGGEAPCYQASPKVYETLACGKFLLVDDQPDVKTLFEDGKHIVVFKDAKDLRDKLNYYLAHDAEREAIAAGGYSEVVKKHTYRRRIEEMISVIERRRPC
jgi:spore maturation protein CgeB